MKFAPLRKFADGGMTSVVDYLKSSGRDASMKDRKILAESFGIKGYKGSGQQNLAMLAKLQERDKAPNRDLQTFVPDENGREYDLGLDSEGSIKGNFVSESDSSINARLNNIRNKYDSIQAIKQTPSVVRKSSTQGQTGYKDAVGPIEKESGFERLRAAGANLGIRQTPSTSLDKDGNVVYDKRDNSVGKSYGWMDRNITNPLEKQGVNTDAFYKGLEGASYITGAGELASGIRSLPAILRATNQSAIKSANVIKGLVAARKNPDMLNTVKTVGSGIKDAAGRIISQREGMSPALRRMANKLDKAEIPYPSKTMSNLMTNQSLMKAEEKLGSQGLRNMMKSAKNTSPKRVEQRLNDLYERGYFKKGGMVVKPKKEDGGEIEDKYVSPYMEYMKKGGMKKKC